MTAFPPQAPGVPATLAGVAPVLNVATAGGDSFPVVRGFRYLFIFRNTGGAPNTPTIDDPTTATPAGATAFNPDVAIGPVPATNGVRVQILDATRFADANGNINVTYSVAPTMTVECYGPI
jgi:hypothetical protein